MDLQFTKKNRKKLFFVKNLHIKILTLVMDKVIDDRSTAAPGRGTLNVDADMHYEMLFFETVALLFVDFVAKSI